MQNLTEIAGQRTNDVITPKEIAYGICDHMNLSMAAKSLINSKLKSNVIQSENKSTVFGDIGQNNQSKLASEMKYDADNLFVEDSQTGFSIAELVVLKAIEKAEIRDDDDDDDDDDEETDAGIEEIDTISMYVSTFSKIFARHIAEKNFADLIGGHIAPTEEEEEEIDIYDKNGKTVQILTSSAKSPKSAEEKISQPENVDKYVVIHYKNDGSAGVGVQKVKPAPSDSHRTVELLKPKSKRAHIMAKNA